MALETAPRLADPDGCYEALMAAHRTLDDAASRRLDAALVILLANHIGDAAVLREAIVAARTAILGQGPDVAAAAPPSRDPTPG